LRAALLLVLPMGCVVTETGDFPLERNYPASVRTASTAAYQLGRIHVLNIEDIEAGTAPPLRLDVIITNLNVNDDLQAAVLVDDQAEPRTFVDIRAAGALERSEDISFESPRFLEPGCHRVELQLSRRFFFPPPFGFPPCPEDPDDLGRAVWWFFTRQDDTDTFDPAQCPEGPEPVCPD
jgi:hypothetical protein